MTIRRRPPALAARLGLVALLALAGLARAQEAPAAPRAPARDAPAVAADASFRLTILHTNDLHGQVLEPPRGGGGLVALGRAIRQERDRARARGDAVLLLDAGDIFKGTPEGDLTDGAVVVAWMNHLGYDALTIGNHEFDHGVAVAAGVARGCEFPVLGGNITEDATGRRPDWLGRGVVGVDPALRGAAVVRTLRGSGCEARVAVVGVTTSEMKSVTLKGVTDGLAFEDEAACLERLLAALPPVDLVVLLTHSGVDVDKALAERFPRGVDVIVGGHSHTRLARGARVGPVLVAQTGARGLMLGRVRVGVSLAPARRVSAEADLLPAGDDLQEVLAPFIDEVKAKVDRPLGTLTRDLDRESGYRSSGLGNLHCDLMRRSAGADVAFHNKTGIRADLKAGVVRERDVYQVAPFGNTVATVKLAGRDLRDLLEGMLASTARLLEVSGVVVTCDPSRHEGQRLLDARVGGAPLDPARVYLVATNNFLVTGGDGHVAFTRGVEPTDTNVVLLDLLRAHFTAHDPFDPGALEERIVSRR